MKATCGCGHAQRSHFPACMAELRRTMNQWGGGKTVLCGCPAFGSPAGDTLGRRRIRCLLRDLEAELGRALDQHAPMASGHEAQSVIAEELHEFTLAVWFGMDQKGQPSDPRHEAIQLAAMALRYLLDIEETPA